MLGSRNAVFALFGIHFFRQNKQTLINQQEVAGCRTCPLSHCSFQEALMSPAHPARGGLDGLWWMACGTIPRMPTTPRTWGIVLHMCSLECASQCSTPCCHPCHKLNQTSSTPTFTIHLPTHHVATNCHQESRQSQPHPRESRT